MEGTERHVRFKGTIYITTPFHVISGLMVHTGTIPYARDITDLAIGAHTIAVTATGVNGATAAVTEFFTRPGKHIYTHACMDGCSRGAYMTESVLRVHAFVPLAEFLRCTGILNSSVLAIQCNSSKALKDVWCTLDNKETHACKQSSVPPAITIHCGSECCNHLLAPHAFPTLLLYMYWICGACGDSFLEKGSNVCILNFQYAQ